MGEVKRQRGKRKVGGSVTINVYKQNGMKKSQVMKNDKGSVMVKYRVVGEVKRKRWKEKVGESVTVVRGRRSFCFCFFVDSSEKKSLKNKRRDKK